MRHVVAVGVLQHAGARDVGELDLGLAELGQGVHGPHDDVSGIRVVGIEQGHLVEGLAPAGVADVVYRTRAPRVQRRADERACRLLHHARALHGDNVLALGRVFRQLRTPLVELRPELGGRLIVAPTSELDKLGLAIYRVALDRLDLQPNAFDEAIQIEDAAYLRVAVRGLPRGRDLAGEVLQLARL